MLINYNRNFRTTVKTEPNETEIEQDEELFNPYLSYGSQNDVFIVDGIKEEPDSSLIPKSEPEKENIELYETHSFSGLADCNAADEDDDDFTWQQDDNDDFMFGLNNASIKKSTIDQPKPSTSTVSVAVKIETEPQSLIKEEPLEIQHINYQITSSNELEKEEDCESPKPKRRKVKKESTAKKGESKKRDPKVARPYEIKKDPEEIEAHKKKKLTGKKACKFCASVFKTQTEMDRHKCEYLKCDPDKFICRICFKQLSRNTFSNHMGYVHGQPK